MRVGALAIGRYSRRSTFPSKRRSLMPHQSGFFASTVFTPGSYDTSLKGPVPMALREANVGSLAVKFCGSAEAFFVAHALLMMGISPMAMVATGLGASLVNSTV